MAAIMSAQTSQLKSFNGLRSAKPVAASKVAMPRTVRGRKSVATRAAFLGSPENIIMVASTTAFLFAGRFGLAPTSTRSTTAGLRLVENKSAGLMSNDPAGFTAVDVLALGAFGHAIGAGVILGLRATGNL